MKFVEKPPPLKIVEATQWNKPGDHSAVRGADPSSLCGCVIFHGELASKPHIHPPTKAHWQQYVAQTYVSVNQGDWIIESEHNMEVLPDEEFKAKYEPISPLQEATTDPDLLKLLNQARERKMTFEEIRQQKISWVWGMLPKSNQQTKEDVEQILIESGLISPRETI